MRVVQDVLRIIDVDEVEATRPQKDDEGHEENESREAGMHREKRRRPIARCFSTFSDLVRFCVRAICCGQAVIRSVRYDLILSSDTRSCAMLSRSRTVTV